MTLTTKFDDEMTTIEKTTLGLRTLGFICEKNKSVLLIIIIAMMYQIFISLRFAEARNEAELLNML
jgi:ACR3 family arsenite efflux pump ArsB